MYEAIIRGDVVTEPGVPESFRVLVRELQSLGLNVDLLKAGEVVESEDAKMPAVAEAAVAKE
jgi:DNA-directed RNA polymerase subunit beta